MGTRYEAGSLDDVERTIRNWSWANAPRDLDGHRDRILYLQPILGELHRAVMFPFLKEGPQDRRNQEQYSRWNHYVAIAGTVVDCLGDPVATVTADGTRSLKVEPGFCALVRLKNGQTLHGSDRERRRLTIRAWLWNAGPPDDPELRSALERSPVLRQHVEKISVFNWGRPSLFEAPYHIYNEWKRCRDDNDCEGPENYVWKIALSESAGPGGNRIAEMTRCPDAYTAKEATTNGHESALPIACCSVIRKVVALSGDYTYHDAIVRQPDRTQAVARLQQRNALACSNCSRPIGKDDVQARIDPAIGVICGSGCRTQPVVEQPTIDPTKIFQAEIGPQDLEGIDPFAGA